MKAALKTKRLSVSAEAPVAGSWQNPRSNHEAKNLMPHAMSESDINAEFDACGMTTDSPHGELLNPFALFTRFEDGDDYTVEVDDGGAARVIHTGVDR